MKRLVLFLFAALFVFAGAFTAARWIDTNKEEANQETTRRFIPAPYVLKNRPFSVVIIGMNNGATIEKTLSSVFSQNYENYRLIYIDDASTDGSVDLVRDLIYDSSHIGQVAFIQNEQPIGILANLFRAVQSCADNEIVVVLHGEDWLAHEWVLQKLNAYYADPDLWISYGQCRDFPAYQLGICRDLKEPNFRNQPFVASHLKSFYAGLFKKIREADFICAGSFLPASADMAYMIPMLEMAKDHYHFIPEVLYISNKQAAYKEDREIQMRCEKFIRALDPYAPLDRLNEEP